MANPILPPGKKAATADELHKAILAAGGKLSGVSLIMGGGECAFIMGGSRWEQEAQRTLRGDSTESADAAGV